MRLPWGATQCALRQALALELRREYDLAPDATPLDAYPARLGVMQGVEDGLGSILTPAQAQAFQKISPIWSEMKTGTVRNAYIGVDSPGLHEALSREWQNHYRFDDDQRERSGGILNEYSAAAKRLLHSYDLLDGRKPSPQERDRLVADLADLQLRYERTIVAMLSEEQRRQLQVQPPLLIHFRPGGEVRVGTDGVPGF